MSIKTKIKSLLASEDVKINELAKLLTEKSKKEILPNTISKKIGEKVFLPHGFGFKVITSRITEQL